MGGEGRKAENIMEKATPGSGYLGGRAAAVNDPRVANLLTKYGSGGLSLQDAISQAQDVAGSAARAARERAAREKVETEINNAVQNAPEPMRAQLRQQLEGRRDDMYKNALSQLPDDAGAAEASISDLITTNPIAAQRYITDSIQSNPLTSRLFGKGGELDRSIEDTQKFMQQGDEADAYAKQIAAEERDLASRGFSLTPEDYEAYGQMSDELARTFATRENDLARSLTSRGLAAAPSGQAASLFSGLQGNKFEQLAKAQRDVAQQRMESNQQRLNSTRAFLGQQQGQANSRYGLGLNSRSQTMGLGNMQNQYMDSLFGRNMAGRQQNFNESMGVAGHQLANKQAQQNQINEGFQQYEATRGPTFGEVLGGIGSAAAGGLAGGFTGTVGKNLGNKLFK